MSEPARTSWRGWVQEVIAAVPTDWDGVNASPLAGLPDHLFVLWLRLGRHANPDGIAWPSITMLAKAAGKHRRNIMRHLDEGERRNPPLWKRMKASRKSTRDSMRYRVFPLVAQTPLVKDAGLVALARVTGGANATSLVAQTPHRTKPMNKAIEQQQDGDAAAADISFNPPAEADPIREALVAAGIAEPARRRLIAELVASPMTPTQAAAMVASKAAVCRAGGKGGGILIAEIGVGIEQAEVRARRQQESQAQAMTQAQEAQTHATTQTSSRLAKDNAERAAASAAAAEREAFIKGLSPDDHASLKAKAVAEHPHMASIWARAEGQGLHVAMRSIYQRQLAEATP